MFVWTSGFQNPLVHTDFNMFNKVLVTLLSEAEPLGAAGY